MLDTSWHRTATVNDSSCPPASFSKEGRALGRYSRLGLFGRSRAQVPVAYGSTLPVGQCCLTQNGWSTMLTVAHPPVAAPVPRPCLRLVGRQSLWMDGVNPPSLPAAPHTAVPSSDGDVPKSLACSVLAACVMLHLSSAWHWHAAVAHRHSPACLPRPENSASSKLWFTLGIPTPSLQCSKL